MLIDMHVHTSKYSKCAKSTPEQIAYSAVQNGLDGVVITEHDYLWKRNELNELQDKFPQIKFFTGIEVSSSAGHILVYGLPDMDRVYVGISPEKLVKIVHEYNGIAVLPHPCRKSDEMPFEIMQTGIDGIEVMSMNIRTYMKDAIDRLKKQYSIFETAGSDAHKEGSIGTFATDFNIDIENEQDLVKALRSRQFVLYKDERFIENFNIELETKVKLASEYLYEEKPTDEIRKELGLSNSEMNAIIRNKNIKLF